MSTRCAALVYKRDQLRVCRDGKRKFRMHYEPCQCMRPAAEDGLCRQHRKMELDGRSIQSPRWVTRKLPTAPAP